MELVQTSQIIVFAYSIIVGLIFAIIYDLFKVIRYFNKVDKVLIFVVDIIFMMLCGLLYFYFSIGFNQGQIRAYTIIGIILGFVLYLNLIGRFTDKFILMISEKILLLFRICKSLFKKFTNIIIKIQKNIDI